LSNNFALHTDSVTERDRLAALARAAGFGLLPEDLEALLPAWNRYQELVAALKAAEEDPGGPGS
jgi:hypothetical protein